MSAKKKGCQDIQTQHNVKNRIAADLVAETAIHLCIGEGEEGDQQNGDGHQQSAAESSEGSAADLRVVNRGMANAIRLRQRDWPDSALDAYCGVGE